jgi:hypothetical protein
LWHNTLTGASQVWQNADPTQSLDLPTVADPNWIITLTGQGTGGAAT